MYGRFVKRTLDILLSISALLVLSPVLLVLTLLGWIMMKGNPFYTQLRPGYHEKIFKMIKFRSMTEDRDEEGNYLPDEARLTKYGHFIRATSLDELPEFLNILKGDMSLVGPRPLLVRDMVFMTPEQRKRHSVRPGLTGLAQCSGRNALLWENKLQLDLVYIREITFMKDLRIVLKTAKIVISGGDGGSDETEVTDDYGDYLLSVGRVTAEEYKKKQQEAKELLNV